MTGKKLLTLAGEHIGEDYIFGVVTPKDNAEYNGAWDCAEFTSWLVYQVTGKLYGCFSNTSKPATADAYTGFYKRDAEKLGTIISVAEAINTPGAFLLRTSSKTQTVGHIAVSDGKGGTVEAHSTKYGVIKSTANGRRWDIGILIPGITYEPTKAAPVKLTPIGVVYRLKTPLMKGDAVKKIQKALKIDDDGKFGANTEAAVKAFQLCAGLVPDGEVGTVTAKALKIKL